MTVKIRQLLRVPGQVKPPVPPPVVIMTFVQQPTDTQINQPFDPEVKVQISDGGQDVLLLTINTGDCHIQFQYATADSTGVATFTGLTAGNNPSLPEGCTVRVHNVTRPGIQDIISQVFHVSFVPQTLLTDLISYWPLDESGIDNFGGTEPIHDVIGPNTLEVVGSLPWYEPGIINSYRYNPSPVSNRQNYGRIASNSTLNPVRSFTFSLWVIPFSVMIGPGLIAKEIQPSADQPVFADREYELYLSTTGVMQLYVFPNAEEYRTVASSSLPLSINTWYFIVAWYDYDAGTLNMQVNNGTVTSSVIGQIEIQVTDSPFNLFSRDFGPSADLYGGLDEVGYWKRALTANERTALYNNGNGLPLGEFGNVVT